MRGRNGERFTVVCPRKGAMGIDPMSGNAEVWATDTYTDDSAMCVATLDAGRINLTSGGQVTIEIRAGA